MGFSGHRVRHGSGLTHIWEPIRQRVVVFRRWRRLVVLLNFLLEIVPLAMYGSKWEGWPGFLLF